MCKKGQNNDNRYNNQCINDNEDVEALDSFCFLGSTINSNEQSFRNYGTDKHLVKQPKKIRIVQIILFPFIIYGSKIWTWKKQNSKIIDAFEIWCWQKLLRVQWKIKKTTEEINSELLLKPQKIRLKLLYFRHITWRPKKGSNAVKDGTKEKRMKMELRMAMSEYTVERPG